jgi:hypothetical protein
LHEQNHNYLILNNNLFIAQTAMAGTGGRAPQQSQANCRSVGRAAKLLTAQRQAT